MVFKFWQWLSCWRSHWIENLLSYMVKLLAFNSWLDTGAPLSGFLCDRHYGWKTWVAGSLFQIDFVICKILHIHCCFSHSPNVACTIFTISPLPISPLTFYDILFDKEFSGSYLLLVLFHFLMIWLFNWI